MVGVQLELYLYHLTAGRSKHRSTIRAVPHMNGTPYKSSSCASRTGRQRVLLTPWSAKGASPIGYLGGTWKIDLPISAILGRSKKNAI